jgi:phosphate transport system protein
VRDALRLQLTDLTDRLAETAHDVAQAMADATTSLVDRRLRLAEQVIAGDATIDARRDEIEQRAVAVLALHQPVTTDLRRAVAVIHIADDIERMGDLARHVAEAARRRHPAQAVPEESRPLLRRLGRTATDMALKAAEVLRTGNVLLAAELDGDDDEMDRLHAEVFTVLMDPGWQHGVEAAVDLTLLARFLERYADHAVAIAKRMIHAVVGGGPDPLPI